MGNAYIVGTGLTKFGKHLERSIRSLVEEAAREAMADAELSHEDIGMVFFGYPMTAFVLVPIHFRLQIPKESDVVAAFATWLVSGVLAFAFRWLFP